MYLWAFKTVPTGAANLRTVNTGILTVNPGVQVWPHGCDLAGVTDPCLCLVTRGLVDDGAAGQDNVVVTGVDAVNVNLNNLGGVAQDVKIQIWMISPHFGNEGAPLAPACKAYARQTLPVEDASVPVPLLPPDLVDTPPAPLLNPTMHGIGPLDGGFWCHYVAASVFGNAPIVINDDPGPAADIQCQCSSMIHHSPQRVPAGTLAGQVLMFVGAPVVVVAGAPLVYPHGLQVGGVGVIPDLEWLIPVDGPGPGVPLAAAMHFEWTGHDAVNVSMLNAGGVGEDVTVIPCALYVHSSVRDPA